MIDYTECEKGLGVSVNTNFKWDDHQLKVLNKAHLYYLVQGCLAFKHFSQKSFL